ncbi:MAG: anaerobic glycerol-3-phosphate dehydrogenase subunit A [Ardenticatenaceae bacterium]|nr:anaerobic glycerol-3-phosphate dehydrogenase subunit A [Ardenticatenaceae bacterium]MCB8950235.1 anaerobic glycerol-3-phosphate dehydrogenase subunit A [Ardenticatenaceae bacterium]
MRKIETEVLVIGGGATGTGVVYDLAQRGFKTILVEKRDLTHGTTGRYHGLLHSGGRYVVKDPKAATECIEENIILRKIMPHCLEDTSGFFVSTPWDDPNFGDKFMQGCRDTGVPCEEISVAQMLREEPHLNPNISRCFRVPDGSADSFLATQVVAEGARQYGAQILNYHEVKTLVREGDRITGAICHDLVTDEDVTIVADMVVNASGAWAGKIAHSGGVEVNVQAGKGTMVALSYRIINTVVNRCKMPADGDIIVPIHTVSVIGTTDERVPDPEHFAIEPWEVKLMLQEADKLVPGFSEMRILRAWGGVRPLYQETKVADTRDVTRAYTLLDHETRDGLQGFITITGGKWTTFRQMAQVTADRVCEKLNTERACRTHEELLPHPFEPGHNKTYHTLGARLARTEQEKSFGELICECELASRSDIESAINEGEAKTLDDIRRDVRMGMGPCQGGFCTLRTIGIWHQLHKLPIENANVALRDFLQERWKGLLPILWGAQLKQERLDELIYLSVLNADHLPGEKASRLGPKMYEKGTVEENPDAKI